MKCVPFLRRVSSSKMEHATIATAGISTSSDLSLTTQEKESTQSRERSVLLQGQTTESSFLSSLYRSPQNPSATSASSIGVQHAHAIKDGLSRLAHVGNRFIDAYSKKHLVVDAQKVFDEVLNRNVITWTTLISAYSRDGSFSLALDVLSEMVVQGDVAPNLFTLASAFRCCASLVDVGKGKEIHGWLVRNEIGSDVVMKNSMVYFYAKCGDFESARRVFEGIIEKNVESWNIMISALLEMGDGKGAVEMFKRLPSRNVVSWNTIISGQIRIGLENAALELLYQMVVDGIEFNEFSFPTALALVGNLDLPSLGRELHGRIFRRGLNLHVFIRNSLIDMYCKCGMMESASFVFRSMPWFSDKSQHPVVFKSQSIETTVSWSSMIAGYLRNGRGGEAVYLFKRMLCENVRLDQLTLTSVMAACSDSGILEQGRQVHSCIEKLGHEFDVVLASAITDMYAKCGNLDDAKVIFHRSQVRNVVLWTSLIVGFALNGQGKDAIRFFEMMLKEKVSPNQVSYVGVLSACSHAGLVEQGRWYFNSMQEIHGLEPRVEHYTCMVDLLARASHLTEAKDFILKNNISHLRSVWSALLSGCRIHNNVEMTEWVAEKMIQLEPLDPNSYILLSNMYSRKMQWVEASRVRSLMQDKGVVCQPGQSWIQLKGNVHVFVAGDRSHRQIDEICSYLEKIIERLKEMGYRKDTSLIMQDVEEEERETILQYHSEKLAVAFGIINTPFGVPIRVMKNLRVCGDCHTAIKMISQATRRDILLRDAYRFHHFKHGTCSCGDFW